MYARTDSPKYLCRKCNNKVSIPELESIFHKKIKGFFGQPERLAAHILQSEQALREKEELIAVHQKKIEKLREEMQHTFRLSAEGHITPQGFGEFYKPAEQQLNKLMAELPNLQGEVDILKISHISEADVLAEANTLYDRWPSLPIDDRRKIAETVCEKITIGQGKIRITFTGIPSSRDMCKSLTHLSPASMSHL
jgi:site-specific DNA recombinase